MIWTSASADNVLTIKGETKSDEEIDEQQYHMRERHYGNVLSQHHLPLLKLTRNTWKPAYDNGIMKLNIPKAEVSKPRKISIRSDKLIEGESSTVG